MLQYYFLTVGHLASFALQLAAFTLPLATFASLGSGANVYLGKKQSLTWAASGVQASSLGTFDCGKVAAIASPSATAANSHRSHLKTSAALAVVACVYQSYVQLLFDVCFCKWYKDDELLL